MKPNGICLIFCLLFFVQKKSWQKKTGGGSVWSQNVSSPKSRQAQKSYNYPHNPHGAPAKKAARKMTKRPKKAAAASMVTTSDGSGGTPGTATVHYKWQQKSNPIFLSRETNHMLPMQNPSKIMILLKVGVGYYDIFY